MSGISVNAVTGEVTTFEAAPAVVPIQVPQVVSRAQGRAALHNAGLLTQVDAIASDPLTDPLTVIALNDAQTFDRNSPTLIALAGVLGLTETDLDNLFMTALEIVI